MLDRRKFLKGSALIVPAASITAFGILNTTTPETIPANRPGKPRWTAKSSSIRDLTPRVLNSYTREMLREVELEGDISYIAHLSTGETFVSIAYNDKWYLYKEDD